MADPQAPQFTIYDDSGEEMQTIRQANFSAQWSAVETRIVGGESFFHVFTCAANVIKYLPGWSINQVQFDRGIIEATCSRWLRAYDVLILLREKPAESPLAPEKMQLQFSLEIQITPQRTWLNFSRPQHIIDEYFAGYEDLYTRWELTRPED